MRLGFNVPPMPDEQIEAEACALLSSYTRKTGISIPVPAFFLDKLIRHLKLYFEMYDLRKEFKLPDVLGALYLRDRLIRIDETLDPDEHPFMLGRFNFSCAHEIGHWCLHRSHAEVRQSTEDLFGEPEQPSIICRTSQKKTPIEIQADKFASYLLMPRAEVIWVWHRMMSLDRFRLSTLDVVDRQKLSANTTSCCEQEIEREQQYNNIIEAKVAPIARTFQVSPRAMRIRLERLGMIVLDLDAIGPLFEAA